MKTLSKIQHRKVLVALLLVSTAQAVQAEAVYPFDRVFTSPQQRAELDRMRRGASPATTHSGAPAVDVPVAAPKIVVSGIVIRDDGQTMVWLDGKSELTSKSASDSPAPSATVLASDPLRQSPSVRVTSQAAIRTLKPGQVWLLDSNQVQEAYELPLPPSMTSSARQAGQGDNLAAPPLLDTLDTLKQLQDLSQP